MRPYLEKNPSHKKRRAGGVAQVVEVQKEEFKPQWCKKQRKKN
jgi:hypothetical protein